MEKPYFDIQGFVQTQVEYLNDKSPLVKKRWKNNDSEEIKILKIGNWEKEFEMLKNADINKKGLLKSYNITKIDSTETYEIKTGEKAAVKNIEVMKDNDGNILELKATLESENYLFKSNSFIKLILKNNQLQRYSFSMYQKMIFGQGKNISINGEIL